jgi:hypothetical protein
METAKRHRRVSPYSGGMRAQDGITVFVSSADGERDVLMYACLPIRGALTEVCRDLDAREGRWYIDVISSPTTIWRDLQGERWQTGRDTSGGFAPRPEARMLGAIGRLDLLREQV